VKKKTSGKKKKGNPRRNRRVQRAPGGKQGTGMGRDIPARGVNRTLKPPGRKKKRLFESAPGGHRSQKGVGELGGEKKEREKTCEQKEVPQKRGKSLTSSPDRDRHHLPERERLVSFSREKRSTKKEGTIKVDAQVVWQEEREGAREGGGEAKGGGRPWFPREHGPEC